MYQRTHDVFHYFSSIVLYAAILLVTAFKLVQWIASRRRVSRLMKAGVSGKAKVTSLIGRNNAILVEVEFVQAEGGVPIRVIKGFRMPPKFPKEGEEIEIRYDVKFPKECVLVGWSKYQVDIFDVPNTSIR